MPIFTIYLEYNVPRSTVIDVEADSAAEAQAKAMEEAGDYDFDTNWDAAGITFITSVIDNHGNEHPISPNFMNAEAGGARILPGPNANLEELLLEHFAG